MRRRGISTGLSLRKSVVTPPRRTVKVGRNEPCPCGSGKKYKDCCISKGERYLVKMYKKQGKIEGHSLVKSLLRLFKSRKKET